MAQQPEARFVNEFLQTHYPRNLQWKRVRLGTLPDKSLSQIYKVVQRWVDAVVIEDFTVLLIEAKMSEQLAGVAQLLLYKDLFRETPEFSAYHASPQRLILVGPYRDAETERMCGQHGIEYVVFSPEWVR